MGGGHVDAVGKVLEEIPYYVVNVINGATRDVPDGETRIKYKHEDQVFGDWKGGKGESAVLEVAM